MPYHGDRSYENFLGAGGAAVRDPFRAARRLDPVDRHRPDGLDTFFRPRYPLIER
jgi:hypothetical protein